MTGEARAPGASWIGRCIDDRYVIQSQLGEGGMGAVFLAEHVKLAKKVALKVILPQFVGDGDVAARFAREAMASAKLEHPNVVAALDYGTLAEGGAYLVMQLARGRSLRDVMTERKGDVALAMTVGAQIADALASAHAARIVHRDLKPENVVLESRDGGGELARVLDFGIARVMDASPSATKSPLTRAGTIMGTPGYMAPEQALGEVVDERADLYALGVILWEIVAGETLFPDDDLTAIVTRQLTSAAPPLRTKRASAPPELDAMIANLLAPREQRTLRAVDVRDGLLELTIGLARTNEPPRPEGPVATAPTLVGRESEDLSNASGRPRADVRSRTRSTLATAPSFGHAAADTLRALPNELKALLALLSLVLLGVVLAGVVGSGGHADAATVREESGGVPSPRMSGAPTPAPPTNLLSALAAVVAGPPPLEAELDVIATSDDRDARAAAAERILAAAEPSELARHAAEVELARGCRDRREHLRALLALGDRRAVPLLERLDELPRRGCGFLGSQDCHRCMRSEIRDGLRSLRDSP